MQKLNELNLDSYFAELQEEDVLQYVIALTRCVVVGNRRLMMNVMMNMFNYWLAWWWKCTMTMAWGWWRRSISWSVNWLRWMMWWWMRRSVHFSMAISAMWRVWNEWLMMIKRYSCNWMSNRFQCNWLN